MSKPNQLNSSPVFARFAVKSEKVELRTESFQGRDCLVVPVVALVGGIVVEGMLSEGPEYIPAHVLAAAPQSLNGRPVVNIHPISGNGEGSANTPELWQKECFGQVWNAEFSDNRLRCEVWLDRSKAEEVGPDALEVLTRAESDQLFEVSIGAWVWLTEEEGISPDGQPYEFIWQAAIYDHLACGLQAQGGVGACDVEAGCGGPRYYTAKQAIAIRANAARTKEPSMNLTLLAALMKNVDHKALADQLGKSMNEMWRHLSDALRAAVPGYLYIVDVYLDNSTMIYVAMPGDEYQYWRCKYELTSDGATTSLHKRVEPTTTWKPVANTAGNEEAESDPEAAAATAQAANKPCACRAHSAQAACQCHEKENEMKKVKELAGKLVACAAAPFTADDTAKLEAMSEAQLESLVKVYSEPQPAPTPELTPASEPRPEPKSAPETVTLTKEQHQHLTQLALREATREKKHRSHLIAALVADESVKAIYGGEKELGERPTDELEKLAQLVGVDDGSDATADMRASAGVLTSGNEPEYKPLNSWGIRGPTADQLGVKPAN